MAAQGTALTPTLSVITGSLEVVRGRPDSPRKDWYLAVASVHGKLAAACDDTFQSLGSGQSTPLVPWAQSAGDELQPSSPQQCANINNYQAPNTISLTQMTSADAQSIMGQLSNPPAGWVVLNESGASDAATGGGGGAAGLTRAGGHFDHGL